MISPAPRRAVLLSLMVLTFFAHPAISDDSKWAKRLAEGRLYLATDNQWGAERDAKACVLEARQFGITNFRVGQSLDLLAAVYYREGNFAEAKRSANESLTILLKAFGTDSKELIGPLGVLSKIFADEGDFDDSLKLCRKNILIAEKSNPGALPEVLATYMIVLAKIGKYSEAETVKQRLCSLSGKRQSSLNDLTNQALLESALAAWPMAEKTAQSAVQLAQKDRTAGSDIRLGQALALLANVYYLDGKYTQAIETARRGMPLFETATAPQKCELLSLLAVMGKASLKARDTDAALKSFGRLYELAPACKDKSVKAIATTLDPYRLLLLKVGRTDEYLKISRAIPTESIKELCTPISHRPQHTLVFPVHYSIGDIYVFSDNDERPLGSAAGRVHVDAAMPLELHVINTDLAANIKSLAQVGPDEFWSLSFARSNISDDGLPCFTKLSGLHDIDLHSSKVTDKGMDCLLSSLKSLYVINLGRTHITNNTLSQLVKTSAPIIDLDLSNTDIDEKAGFELKQLPLLTGLSLVGTKMSDTTVKQLTALKHLESLNLSKTLITDESGPYIAQLGNLKKLSLSDTNTSDTILKSVVKLRRLENLNLSRTRLTDDGLNYLTNLPSLKVLFLDGTSITADCIAPLKRMAKLKTLSVYFTRNGLPHKIRDQIPACELLGP
jgi:tetratricopeptide (TPR) repeat protein